MIFTKFKKPLTIAVLTSTFMTGGFFPIPVMAQAVINIDENVIKALLLLLGLTFEQVEGATVVDTEEVAKQRKTSEDGNIQITTTGSITNANAPAVLVDSGNTLTIIADNTTLSKGIAVTGTPNDATLTFPAAVGITEAGGAVTIGQNSKITAVGSGYAVGVDLKGKTGATITNGGTLTGAGGSGGVYVVNSVDPVVLNQGTGTITGDSFGIVIENNGGPVTNYSIVNESGGTITQTNAAATQSFSAIRLVGNNSGMIANQGTITNTSVSGAAILGDNGGQTVVIDNFVGGTISGPNDGIRFNLATANNDITLNNYATIQGLSGVGLNILGISKGTITNFSGGVIDGGSLAPNSGIVINNTFTGDLNNYGTVTGTNAGIFIGGNFTGNLTSTGSVSVTSATASAAIDIEAGKIFTGNITTSGTVSASGANMAAVRLDGAVVGDVTLGGSLTSDNFSTLQITDGVTGTVTTSGALSMTNDVMQNAVHIVNGGGGVTGKFVNSGAISSASTTHAAVLVAADVTQGFYNSGTITSSFMTALDFTNANNTNYFQTGGNVVGDIQGHNGGFTATFTGGTLTGNLLLGIGNDTVNIQNTVFTQSILGNGASNDTLNITGSFYNDTPIKNFLNVNIGDGVTTFGALTVAPGNTLEMNRANGAFTVNSGSTVDVQGIIDLTENITKNTTFDIKNGGLVFVNQGGVVDSNSKLVNDGQLLIEDTGTASFSTASHSVGNDGLYSFEVTDSNTFGKLTLGPTASDLTGDSIGVRLTGDGFIQAGDTFKVINTGAPIIGNVPGTLNIVQPASQTLRFIQTNAINAADITLTANRTPFQNVVESPNASSIGVALDLLVDDPLLHPDLKQVISQLDIQPTSAELTEAMESLIPEANGGIIQVSHDINTRTTDTIIGRLEEARNIYDIVKTIQSGDEPFYGFGAWGKVFASSLSQKAIDRVEGYNASSTGITFGFDKILTREFTAGGAITYATADVNGKSDAANDIDMNSIQFTGYGSYDFPGAWYVDMLVSGALNRYKSKRIIEIGNFVRTARADYKAWQYSAKIQGGYHLAYEKYRITPIIGGHFAMLDLDSYTESTAGGVNLAVEPRNIPELVATVGVRFASLNEYVEALYVPEFRILAHYDFIRDTQESTSHFVGNGNVYFLTKGFKPDPLTYNVGTALTAYAQKFTFAISYDLQFKRQFMGHYGFVKLKYEW